MTKLAKHSALDFYKYPPIGGDDWRYAFQTAVVRTLEMNLIKPTTLLDIANAENFPAAVELLRATEYALSPDSSLTEVENILRLRRTELRKLFLDLCIDKPIVELFKSRDDFTNLRLALRRTLTKKPLGNGYSYDGNVSPQLFEEIFTQEKYDLLPDYMTQAIEQAVLAYYQSKDPTLQEQKDIRQIDYALDKVQADYNLRKAHQLKSIFLLGLFKIQIDLTNIRTMLRLKFINEQKKLSDVRSSNFFLEGGFIELERLQYGLQASYDALPSLFFVTPYYRAVEIGTNYLATNKSFLKLEQQCDEFLIGFLKTTTQITAGSQPIIAYLLMKEIEIRNIRLILTAKKNNLDTKLILDRIS